MKKKIVISRMRAWLDNIPIHDPVERRIASLLQVVLIGLMVVIILATIILVTIPAFSLQEKLNVVIGDLFGFLVVALPLGLLRRGYFRASVLSIISILFITPTLAITVVFDLLNNGGIMFQFTLAIILAGLLVSRRALALTFGLSAAVVVFSSFRGQSAAPHLTITNVEMAVNFILFNGLIALFIDRFGVTLRAALNNALERESELQSEVSNRKQAEESLRESEGRYRKLIDHARDVIFTISADGRITSLNPAFEIFTGWSCAEWLERPFDELVAEADRIQAHAQFNRILRGETLRALRLRMHTRTGDLLVVEMNISPQFKDDRVVGLLGIARDMTQEQHAEDALKASEERYRMMFEANPHPMWVYDQETLDFLAVNEAALAHYGYSQNEFLRMTIKDIRPPEEIPALMEDLVQEPQKLEWSGPWKHRRKDGTLIDVEILSHDLLFGERQARLVLANDITERKRVEEQILHERSVLEFIATDASVTEILTNLVLGHEKLFPGTMCSILLLDASGEHLVHGAAPSLPVEYVDAIDGQAIGLNAGSCGTAAFTGEIVIVTDIETDPRWVDYRGMALPHGLRACWSVPFRSAQGVVLGTFAMYYRELRTPEPQELATIASSARLAGIAIERKGTEETLRESQGRLSLFFNQSLDGFFFSMIDEPMEWNDASDKEKILDYVLTHQHIAEVNDAMLEQYRATRENFIGRTASDFFAHDLEQARRFHRNLFDKGRLNLETEERKDDGTPIWIEGDYVCMYNAQNRIIGIFGIQRDITERRQAGEALQQKNHQLQLALETAAMGVWHWNFKTDQVFTTQGSGPISGLPEESYPKTGQAFFELVHPDDRVTTGQRIEQARLTGDYEAEFRIRLHDGTIRWVVARGGCMYDADGVPTALTGIDMDITARKQAEEEVRLSQHRLTSLVASAMDSIISIDSQQKIVLFNLAAEKMFGHTAEELLGQPLDILLPERYRAAHIKDIDHFGRSGVTSRAMTGFTEVTGLRRNGKEFPMDASISQMEVGGQKFFTVILRDITERKQAEEALHASEDFRRLIVDAEPECVKLIAPNGELIEMNSAGLAMLEADSLEQIRGMSIIELVAPEYQDAFRNLHERVLAGESGLLEFEIIGLKGTRRWLETHSVPLRNKALQVEALLGVTRDITERKQAEEKLRESESDLNTTQTIAKLGGWRVELNTGLALWSAELFRLYGRDPALGPPLYRDFLDYVHPEDRQTLLQNEAQAIAERRSFYNEYRVLDSSGGIRWFAARGEPQYDQAGNPLRIFGTTQDITERKHAEEKIERQNQRLIALREIDTAILSADSVKNIVGAALSHIRELIECQRASLALIDWGTNEALIFDVRTVNETSIPRGTRLPLAVLQDMNQTLSKNQPVVINDLTALPDPPPQIQAGIREGFRSLCVLPLFSQETLIGAFSMSSEIPGFFNEEKISLGREVANQVAIAITQSRLVDALEQRVREREKLIEELTAKNAELERFIYTVSHDLKSPLVTIKGFLGYLEQDATTGNLERLKGDSQRIANAVDKMQMLLNDVLELSRIGRFVNPPEIVPFDELAREAISLVEGRIQERGVAVMLQPNLPAVHGDRQRLTEVLQNLLDNAAKFMGDQPEPLIEIGQRGEDAERGQPIFFVRDNGIGIKNEYHERIFGLFNKLDARSEGTGIGLALVKRIIEFHGGRIWVESELGVGTTFLFTLHPLGQPKPSPA